MCLLKSRAHGRVLISLKTNQSCQLLVWLFIQMKGFFFLFAGIALLHISFFLSNYFLVTRSISLVPSSKSPISPHDFPLCIFALCSEIVIPLGLLWKIWTNTWTLMYWILKIMSLHIHFMLLAKLLESSYWCVDNILTRLFQFCLPKWEASVWCVCCLGFFSLVTETLAVSIFLLPPSMPHDSSSLAIRESCKKLLSNSKPVWGERQTSFWSLSGSQPTVTHRDKPLSSAIFPGERVTLSPQQRQDQCGSPRDSLPSWMGTPQRSSETRQLLRSDLSHSGLWVPAGWSIKDWWMLSLCSSSQGKARRLCSWFFSNHPTLYFLVETLLQPVASDSTNSLFFYIHCTGN